MLVSNYLEQFKDLLNVSPKILVTTKKNPSLDQAVSTVVLANSLISQGKNVCLLIENFNPLGIPSFLDVSKIETQLSPKSLIVSVNLENSPIEKINYQTIGTKLEIIITPKEGQITKEAIEFRDTELDFDLIIVAGAQNLEEVGALFLNHKGALERLPVINIGVDKMNTLFGKLNLVEEDAIGLFQLVFRLAKGLQLPLGQKEIDTLYFALVDKTSQFSQNVSVATFRLAADLLELGAQANLGAKAEPEIS